MKVWDGLQGSMASEEDAGAWHRQLRCGFGLQPKTQQAGVQAC